MWPKTTLLPVWPRDAKRLDAPGVPSGYTKVAGVTLVRAHAGSNQ